MSYANERGMLAAAPAFELLGAASALRQRYRPGWHHGLNVADGRAMLGPYSGHARAMLVPCSCHARRAMRVWCGLCQVTYGGFIPVAILVSGRHHGFNDIPSYFDWFNRTAHAP